MAEKQTYEELEQRVMEIEKNPLSPSEQTSR